MNRLKPIIEGLIFLSGDEGLSIQCLCDTCDIDHDLCEKTLDELMKDYLDDSHGFELVNYGGNYKFISKEKIHEYADRLFSSTKMASLSQAALETLAIIAYRQPITRAEIEEIRGVGCDMMIRKLMGRDLIKECGRSDAPGRPFMYEVTQNFMDAFKLQSLSELPDLPNFQEEMRLDEDIFDR